MITILQENSHQVRRGSKKYPKNSWVYNPYGDPNVKEPNGYYDGQPNELSFTRSINPEVAYTSDQGSLQIGDGNKLQYSKPGNGQNLNVSFAFIGTDGSGGGDQFNFDSSFTNSITSSHTQGTTNLTSEQQQNSDGRSDGGSNTEGGSQGGEISVSVSATEKASAGIGDDEVGLSATETAGFKHSWSSTWQNVSSFNATTERSLTSENSDSENENDTQGSDITNTFSFSANIDLSGAIETEKPQWHTTLQLPNTCHRPNNRPNKNRHARSCSRRTYNELLLQRFVQQAVTETTALQDKLDHLMTAAITKSGECCPGHYNAQAGQGLEFANNPALIHSFNTTLTAQI